MRPKRVIVSVLLFSAAPLASSGCFVDDDPAPEVDDMDVNAPKELLALRTELLEAQPEAALTAMAHFRPLCDADGYPLVGNVANKVQTTGLQPSQFCAEVRKRE